MNNVTKYKNLLDTRLLETEWQSFTWFPSYRAEHCYWRTSWKWGL